MAKHQKLNTNRQISLTPRELYHPECPNFDFGGTISDPYGSAPQTFASTESLAVVMFNFLPLCLIIAHAKQTIFWSNARRGTIEHFDAHTKIRSTVIRGLVAPGSLSVDPERKYLFWCNFLAEGSIERVYFDGKNRFDITKGKYKLRYPTALTVDRVQRKLYWNLNNVIHSANYNGDDYKIEVSSPLKGVKVIPDCVVISENKEHLRCWNKAVIGSSRKRSMSTANHVSAIIKHFKETKHRHEISKNVQVTNGKGYMCSYMCQRYFETYHCVCLVSDIKQLQVFDYWTNKTLTSIGYTPIDTRLFARHNFNATTVNGVNTSFYFNVKTQKVFYYNETSKEIRSIYIKSKLKKSSQALVKDIYIPANGFAYDWITNTLYYIDSIEQDVKAFGYNHYFPGTIIRSTSNTVVALALHPIKRFLFIVRRHHGMKTIYKSSMDGKYLSAVANMSRGASDTIIVDQRGNAIMYLNEELQIIEKIDFKGKHIGVYLPEELQVLLSKLSYNYSITDIISDDTMVALKFDLDTETDGNQYQIEPSPIPSRASMVIAKRMNIDYMDYRTWRKVMFKIIMSYTGISILLLLLAVLISVLWYRRILIFSHGQYWIRHVPVFHYD